MRENRPSGSEGGVALTTPSLHLSSKDADDLGNTPLRRLLRSTAFTKHPLKHSWRDCSRESVRRGEA